MFFIKINLWALTHLALLDSLTSAQQNLCSGVRTC